MGDKNSINFRGHSDGIWLLLYIVYIVYKRTLSRKVRIKDFTFWLKIYDKFILMQNWWNNPFIV